jgi:hypothetical protein
MTSGASSESPAPSAKKGRRHYIAPEMPHPHAAVRIPVWKKLWFWLFVVIALLLSMPAMEVAWNILRPDTAKPAPAKWPDYRAGGPSSPDGNLTESLDSPAHPSLQIGRARIIAGTIAAMPAVPGCDADVLAGRRYDAEATPRFIDALVKTDLFTKGLTVEVRKAAQHPFHPGDIAAYDGFLRAMIAKTRIERDGRALAFASAARLDLSLSSLRCASSTEDFSEALVHEREVLAEIRADAALLVTDVDSLKTLLAALARHAEAPSPELAHAQAAAFDAALDEIPDATLRAISAERTPADTGFVRLALAARKPNEHRRRASELFRHFGEALAKPTFAEARQAFPAPGETKDIRLSTALLRDEVIRRLGGDYALQYFFLAQPAPDPGLENFSLKFFALSEVKDPYGEALLLHRRAQLLALIARRDRTRFEAAATAYALAIEYRRANNGGQRPKDTEGLFTGLIELYPLDPFTGDALLYSRKKLTLHSPGADGADLGGLEDPEFASELTQLWEPTVSLDTEPPTNPGAFGLKASDLDKPVTRASDAPVHRP